MNLELLNQVIKKSGKSKAYIASKIGMTKGKLYMKCLGHSAWRVDEAKAISDELNLSKKQSSEIFFG